MKKTWSYSDHLLFRERPDLWFSKQLAGKRAPSPDSIASYRGRLIDTALTSILKNEDPVKACYDFLGKPQTTVLTDSERRDLLTEDVSRVVQKTLNMPAYTAMTAPNVQRFAVSKNFYFRFNSEWQIAVAPDVVLLHPSGVMEVVDWKSGSPRKSHATQMLVYGAFAHVARGIPIPLIKSTLVYVDIPDTAEAVYTVDDFRYLSQIIQKDIRDMETYYEAQYLKEVNTNGTILD